MKVNPFIYGILILVLFFGVIGGAKAAGVWAVPAWCFGQVLCKMRAGLEDAQSARALLLGQALHARCRLVAIALPVGAVQFCQPILRRAFAHHHHAPGLRIAAARSAHGSLQHAREHRFRYRVGTQAPHRATTADGLVETHRLGGLQRIAQQHGGRLRPGRRVRRT